MLYSRASSQAASHQARSLDRPDPMFSKEGMVLFAGRRWRHASSFVGLRRFWNALMSFMGILAKIPLFGPAPSSIIHHPSSDLSVA